MRCMQTSLIMAILFVVGSVAMPTGLVAQTEALIEIDVGNGCKARSFAKRPPDRALWRGGCQSGYAHGPGTLVTETVQVVSISQGEFRNGYREEVWQGYQRLINSGVNLSGYQNHFQGGKRAADSSTGSRELSPSELPAWAQVLARGDFQTAVFQDRYLPMQGASPATGPALSAAPASSSTKGPSLTVGTRVKCNWLGRGTLYPGKVTRASGDNVHISYDDGDQEDTVVSRCQVTAGETMAGTAATGSVTVGTRVQCNWKGRGQLYPGTVTSVRGQTIHISYDDGDQEDTTPARCRVIAAPTAAASSAPSRAQEGTLPMPMASDWAKVSAIYDLDVNSIHRLSGNKRYLAGILRTTNRATGAMRIESAVVDCVRNGIIHSPYPDGLSQIQVGSVGEINMPRVDLTVPLQSGVLKAMCTRAGAAAEKLPDYASSYVADYLGNSSSRAQAAPQGATNQATVRTPSVPSTASSSTPAPPPFDPAREVMHQAGSCSIVERRTAPKEPFLDLTWSGGCRNGLAEGVGVLLHRIDGVPHVSRSTYSGGRRLPGGEHISPTMASQDAGHDREWDHLVYDRPNERPRDLGPVSKSALPAWVLPHIADYRPRPAAASAPARDNSAEIADLLIGAMGQGQQRRPAQTQPQGSSAPSPGYAGSPGGSAGTYGGNPGQSQSASSGTRESLGHCITNHYAKVNEQKSQRGVYEHQVYLTNSCNHGVNVYVCYSGTSSCSMPYVGAGQTRMTTLGIRRGQPGFNYEYTVKRAP